MLKYLFRPSVSRAYHESALLMQRDQLIAMMVESADERIKEAEAKIDATFALVAQTQRERDEARQEYTNAVNRELKATALLHRALTQLQGVRTDRTGGKQLRVARETLFADAMLLGLWGEVKE